MPNAHGRPLLSRVRGRNTGNGKAVYRKQIDEDRGGSNYPNSMLVYGVLLAEMARQIAAHSSGAARKIARPIGNRVARKFSRRKFGCLI